MAPARAPGRLRSMAQARGAWPEYAGGAAWAGAVRARRPAAQRATVTGRWLLPRAGGGQARALYWRLRSAPPGTRRRLASGRRLAGDERGCREQARVPGGRGENRASCRGMRTAGTRALAFTNVAAALRRPVDDATGQWQCHAHATRCAAHSSPTRCASRATHAVSPDMRADRIQSQLEERFA